MRTIQVSESTYAAIWAKWQEGDDGEEGVIRRVLGVDEGKTIHGKTALNGTTGGFRDERYGVVFPEGFRIFRTFKGQQRVANVRGRNWMLDNGRLVTSLNKLSAFIGAPTENAWTGWNYQDEKGETRPISDLRDPSLVRRRVI